MMHPSPMGERCSEAAPVKTYRRKEPESISGRAAVQASASV
jgi:hypothetical protein